MSNDNDSIPKETEKLIERAEQSLKENEKEIFSEIRISSNELSQIAKEETLKLKDSINNQEVIIKDLKDEKILLERNEIQNDIQKNQKLLIDEYKINNKKLNSDVSELESKVDELTISNRKFLINNDELKKTISRYIKHNKNLQISINDLKKIQLEFLNSKSQVREMTDRVKFYQDDNSRLSSEIVNLQKKYETIKNNFDKADKEKNSIFKQIQELNTTLTKNNIVGTPYVKDKIEEDSINSKILNDISKKNLDDEVIKTEKEVLDKEINDIFK